VNEMRGRAKDADEIEEFLNYLINYNLSYLHKCPKCMEDEQL
jgi:hypothetical protein